MGKYNKFINNYKHESNEGFRNYEKIGEGA